MDCFGDLAHSRAKTGNAVSLRLIVPVEIEQAIKFKLDREDAAAWRCMSPDDLAAGIGLIDTAPESTAACNRTGDRRHPRRRGAAKGVTDDQVDGRFAARTRKAGHAVQIYQQRMAKARREVIQVMRDRRMIGLIIERETPTDFGVGQLPTPNGAVLRQPRRDKSKSRTRFSPRRGEMQPVGWYDAIDIHVIGRSVQINHGTRHLRAQHAQSACRTVGG
jgi:hypothetical protein